MTTTESTETTIAAIWVQKDWTRWIDGEIYAAEISEEGRQELQRNYLHRDREIPEDTAYDDAGCILVHPQEIIDIMDMTRSYPGRVSKRVALLKAERDWLLGELLDREDIEDGQDGPVPNQAMTILRYYEGKFGKVER